MQPLSVPLFGMDQSGMVRYSTRVNRAYLGHGHVTILINTEINTEEQAQESVPNLIN